MNQFLSIKKAWLAIYILFFLLLSICPGQVGAQDYNTKQADCFSTQWPHEKSNLIPDPSLTFGRLANGFRYVLMHNSDPRDRVAIYLNVQVGSMYETNSERGYAHFLEHMLFNGSTHFKPGDLIEYFQSVGMDFGGDVNAHTTFDETVYNILLPKGEVEDIKKGFLVMTDYARGALLLEKEVNRERGVIFSEKLARDSVSYRSRVAEREKTLKGTILAERAPIGVDETLHTADSKSLRYFYDQWYRPEKMILVVVGDFNQKEVEPILIKQFSKLKGIGALPSCPELGKIDHDGIDAFYRYEPDDGTIKVSIESYWNKTEDDDSLELQVNQLKKYFAINILQKRMNGLAEKDGAVFERSHVYASTIIDRFGYSGISVNTSSSNWQKSLAVLEQSQRQFITYGVTVEEVELVKKELASYFESSILTSETRKTNSLVRQIIRNLNDNRVFQSPQQEKDLYMPEIDKFKPADINRVIHRLWSHDNRLISLTGNVIVDSNNPEEKIVNTYLESNKKEITRPENLKKLFFPYLVVSEVQKEPVSSNYVESIDTEVFQYENGLILNLKKTEYAKNELHIAVNFGLGKQNEPLPGLALLAESVVKSSGSGRLTDSEFERALAGSSVEYGFGVKGTSFVTEGGATSTDTELLIQTLYTLILDPAIREEVYKNKMKRYEQMYQSIQNDIKGADSLFVDRFLAGGNNLFGLPPWNDFSNLQLSSIKDWLLPIFANAQLEISVVGDFNREEILALVNKYFGNLEKRARPEIKNSPIPFPKGESLDVKIKTRIEKALLTVAWETDDFYNIKRTRRLHMLAGILDERIRLAIREKLGATYSPSVHNSSSRFIPDYGVMTAQMIIEQQNIETVKKAVFEVSEKLISNGVSEEELERIKKPILTSLKDRVRNNRYWLYSVLSLSSVHPEQLEWPNTILTDYDSITTSEMSEYARKYLKREDAAIAVVRPEE